MGESLTERCRVVDEVLRHVNTFYEGESYSHHMECDGNLQASKINLQINQKYQTPNEFRFGKLRFEILFANCKLNIANSHRASRDASRLMLPHE